MLSRLLHIFFTIFLFYSGLFAQDTTISSAIDTAAIEKATDSLKANQKQTLNDTLDCFQLVLARQHEKKGNYDKALSAYQEALKCPLINNKREAFAGIERNEKKLNVWGQRLSNKLSKLWEPIREILLYFVFVLILAFLLLYIGKHLVSLWRSIKRPKVTLDIHSFASISPELNEAFVLQRFKLFIQKSLSACNQISDLKKEISNSELESSKPSISSKELSSLLQITMNLATPKIIPLVPTILNYLSPTNYIVSGFVNFINGHRYNLTVIISKKGKELQIWDHTIDDELLVLVLQQIAHKVVAYIKGYEDNENTNI